MWIKNFEWEIFYGQNIQMLNHIQDCIYQQNNQKTTVTIWNFVIPTKKTTSYP